MSLRLASWNVNSLKVRLGHVIDWLADARPDVLGIQETKLPDEKFPADAIREAGYEVVYAGQPTYNGVAIVSREPATDIITDIPGLDDPQRRVLAATIGGLRFINLYVPNGSEVGSDKYAYKLEWLARLRDWLAAELQQHEQLAVVGDFNIAPRPEDVHDPAEWEGKVLYSEPEREALRSLRALGLEDAFEQAPPEGNRFTWWDYRAAAFRRNRGLRIDHILVSPALAGRCREFVIDLEPRKRERPSDHAPVMAIFD